MARIKVERPQYLGLPAARAKAELLAERELEQLCVALSRQRQGVLQALGIKDKGVKEKEEKRGRKSRSDGQTELSTPLFANSDADDDHVPTALSPQAA